MPRENRVESFMETLYEFSKNDDGTLEEVYVGEDSLAEETSLDVEDVRVAGNVCAAIGAVYREEYKSVGMCYCVNSRMNRELAFQRVRVLDEIAEDLEMGAETLIDAILEGRVGPAVLSNEEEARRVAQRLVFERENGGGG